MRHGHIHGTQQPDGRYLFDLILQCEDCSWSYHVSPLFSHSSIIVTEEETPTLGTRRVRIHMPESNGHSGSTQFYDHYCPTPGSSMNSMNIEPTLQRIEMKLSQIEANMTYVVSAKDQEIAKLKQTIDLLQARLKWAEEEQDGDVHPV